MIHVHSFSLVLALLPCLRSNSIQRLAGRFNEHGRGFYVVELTKRRLRQSLKGRSITHMKKKLVVPLFKLVVFAVHRVYPRIGRIIVTGDTIVFKERE